METPAKDKLYFPNLDGLRFIGAFLIILIHIEGLKEKEGKEIIPWIHYFHADGSLLVSLFFVLSGFLITYLLLKEKENTSTIHLKKFYSRRILKIWPLYYFIGFLGIVALPMLYSYFSGHYSGRENSWYNVLLYALFLPPFMQSLSIGATWSVRVEELFYLLWPIVLKSTKKYFSVFVGVVIIVLLFRNISAILLHLKPIILFRIMDHLSKDYRFSCMAIGGMAAYLHIAGKKQILSFLYRKDVQYGVYILMLLLFIFKVHLPGINFEFYSFLFAFLVLNLATNPQSILSFDYSWMNYLGKISYGLYLYNPIVRILCLEGIEHIYGKDITGWGMNLLDYGSTIFGTILVSTLSYEFFEKPFLRMKRRFTVVKTAA